MTDLRRTFNECVINNAITLAGEYPATAQVYATMALALATAMNEPTERLEISGHLLVDS